ncbi:Protein 21.1 [Giardia lamblia P15]|uniref:Protein 21.1 n=1 Tax=Giardia intestinalis (strain P15) TaxID=658858 RepID=E1EWK4_GIAIA|nr:Protein 21.1 [Giardia lamblia P15]
MIISTPKDWFIAITSRRYDAVSRSIQQFSGSRTPSGDTGLILSVQHHDPNMVKILAPTEAGLVNNSGSTALLVAAELGYLVCCLPLLQYERSIVDSRGCTPLILAARAGNIGCIPFLITDSLLARDCEGRTALDWAVAAGQVEAVRLLSQPELYPIDYIRRAIDLADSMGHLVISKLLCRRIAGCQGTGSISPPASVIISTTPSLSKTQRSVPYVLEQHAEITDSFITENDSSLCLADLSAKKDVVPTVSYLSSAHFIDDDITKMTQQLEHLAQANITLQSNYRSMVTLCDEARLKLTMQKDDIESSISLLTKLKATLKNNSEIVEMDAMHRVFQEKMAQIHTLQHEIFKVTSELHNLTTISSNSILDN